MTPIDVKFDAIIALTGITCYWLGTLREKRKRDKEMAGLVAARLLYKPKVIPTSGVQTNAMWGQNAANSSIQQSSAAQQSNLLGGTFSGSGMTGPKIEHFDIFEPDVRIGYDDGSGLGKR